MAQKPSIPKGTRDFSPTEMVRRNYIFSTIQSVFERYGFMPIETPAMENLSTLLGKYGEEGDRLLFKVLNSGDYLGKVDEEDLRNRVSAKMTHQISEKGLRYDLTVPFARYVVQHRNDIFFPFKRYQIQPVWRADKPQKGRYREFYQCDVDVIGSNSLINELELILIINEVFSKLNIDVKISLNNRKILSGISEYLGVPDKFTDMTVALDKLDKIGVIGVKEELREKGIDDLAISKLEPVLEFTGSNREKVEFLEKLLNDSETGKEGLKEISEIFTLLEHTGIRPDIILDLTLARGLNYYTGAIFEVSAKDVEIGSVCGGGRYDDLTGIFGMKDVSGVGISFGADRIYDVLNQLEKFPVDTICKSQVMFVNFGEKEIAFCLPLLKKIRDAGINAEIYPDSAKMKKQMTYANNKGIEFVAIVGEEELNEKKVTLKNMYTGEQKKLNAEELVLALKWDT